METAINERQLKRARIEWNSFQSIPAFRSTDCPFILVKRQFEEIACLLLVFAVKILSGFQIDIKYFSDDQNFDESKKILRAKL